VGNPYISRHCLLKYTLRSNYTSLTLDYIGIQYFSLKIDESQVISPFKKYWYTLTEGLEDHDRFSGHVIAWCESYTTSLDIRGVKGTNHEYYHLLTAERIERILGWSSGEVAANLHSIGLIITFLSSEYQRGVQSLHTHLRKLRNIIAGQGGIEKIANCGLFLLHEMILR
jgi:hypothetical protein